MLQRARTLRKQQSLIERIVWSKLRARRTNGLKFRRQHVIGPFIVDFYHHASRTIIELDGSFHFEQPVRDSARQTWLMRNGYSVLRFTSHEVTTNLDGVITRIFDYCTTHPGGNQG